MSGLVLIIDNDPQFLANTAEILQLSGYKAATATSSQEGLRLAGSLEPDMILCNLEMPGLDGYRILESLREQLGPALNGISFVCMSVNDQRRAVREAMASGADDYLIRPFSHNELLGMTAIRIKKAKSIRRALRSIRKNIHSADRQDSLQNAQDKILEQLTFKKEVKKKLIYTQGSAGEYFYYVRSGKIKIYQTNASGKIFITRICTPGEFFGYCSLPEGNLHAESAVTMETAEIGFIQRKALLNMLATCPGISSMLVKTISAEMSGAKQNSIMLAYDSAFRRVSEALLYLGKKYSPAPAAEPAFHLNRKDISCLSGIMPESVSRILTDLKQQGIIEVQNRILHIADIDKLRSIKH